MMNKVEMMIEELENNNKVVGNVKFADGTVQSIEMCDELDDVVAIEAIDLEQYEANGYDVDGLRGTWMEVK